MNNVIASKNPKARHYASSESLNFRVAAAVCQKNIGSSYANNVFLELQLSPGKKSSRYRATKDAKREKERVRKGDVTFKRQRLSLKKLRSRNSATSARKEGVAYQSEMSMHDHTPMLNNRDFAEVTDFSQCNVVVFDLETSGFSQSDEILQVLFSLINNLCSYDFMYFLIFFIRFLRSQHVLKRKNFPFTYLRHK